MLLLSHRHIALRRVRTGKDGGGDSFLASATGFSRVTGVFVNTLPVFLEPERERKTIWNICIRCGNVCWKCWTIRIHLEDIVAM